MRDICDIRNFAQKEREKGKKKKRKRGEKERRKERNRESGKSILHMHRSLDIRARHHVTSVVRSALYEVYIIINITHLNMLITIINRAHGQDREASSQVLNENDVWWCIMARSKEK